MKGEKHKLEQIIQKPGETDAIIAANKTLGEVVQVLVMREQKLYLSPRRVRDTNDERPYSRCRLPDLDVNRVAILQ